MAEPTFSKVQLENPDSPGDSEAYGDPGGSETTDSPGGSEAYGDPGGSENTDSPGDYEICKERFCEVV